MVSVMRGRFWIILVVLLSAGVAYAQTKTEETSELPDTKEVTAEALAQALNRSELAKEYLGNSEKVQQDIQNASTDKRSALKALAGADITLLWLEIDFFTLIAYQAHMEATSALSAVTATKENTDS